MTKPYSEDLRTRGRGELPRGGTTVQHRREQRGAASEAVAPAKGLRTIRRIPLEPHRREHSSAASPRTSAKTTSRPRDMDQLDRITL